jgi:hypothetical protein
MSAGRTAVAARTSQCAALRCLALFLSLMAATPARAERPRAPDRRVNAAAP